jgi:hypothetical protein
MQAGIQQLKGWSNLLFAPVEKKNTTCFSISFLIKFSISASLLHPGQLHTAKGGGAERSLKY